MTRQPNPEHPERSDATGTASERRGGIPVRTSGTPSIDAWRPTPSAISQADGAA